MPAVYDPRATKKSVSLSINADLLARAAELDVNLSDTLEQALLEAIAQREHLCAQNRQTEPTGSVEGIDAVLLAAAVGLFGNETQAVKWLNTPARALGHKCPVDADTQEALEVIERLAHGFCA